MTVTTRTQRHKASLYSFLLVFSEIGSETCNLKRETRHLRRVTCDVYGPNGTVKATERHPAIVSIVDASAAVPESVMPPCPVM